MNLNTFFAFRVQVVTTMDVSRRGKVKKVKNVKKNLEWRLDNKH